MTKLQELMFEVHHECQAAREQGFEQGREQGLVQGLRQAEAARRHARTTLVRQAQRKFGPDPAARLAALLAGVWDPERTAEVADLIIDCASGRAFLDRVRAVQIERVTVADVLANLKDLEDLQSPMFEALWDKECRTARQEGLERGLEQGIEQGMKLGHEQGRLEAETQARHEQSALLRRRVERKFGPDAAAELGGLLERVAEPAEALDIAMLVADCDTAEDFLAQVQRNCRQG